MQLFRKWYIPGWISLCFLPPLFIHYTTKAERTKHTYAIKINFPKLASQCNPASHYDGYRDFCVAHLPLPRTYSTVELNDDEQQNNNRLFYAAGRMKEILLKGDTVNGVHFQFANDAQYKSFITVLDLLAVTRAKTYIADRNDIWFCYIPEKPRMEENELPMMGCYIITYIKPDVDKTRTFSSVLKEAIGKTRENGLSILIAFLVFAILISWSCFKRGKAI